MQVFSFVTGGSCLKRPSLAHVTSREYRITLPGSAQLLSKIVDLPGKVARRDHGRSVPAALKGNDDGQAFYGILDGTLVIKDGEPVAFEETADIALKIIEINKARYIVHVWTNRSEEHTTELQSLMRISYADLCWQKKTDT